MKNSNQNMVLKLKNCFLLYGKKVLFCFKNFSFEKHFQGNICEENNTFNVFPTTLRLIYILSFYEFFQRRLALMLYVIVYCNHETLFVTFLLLIKISIWATSTTKFVNAIVIFQKSFLTEFGTRVLSIEMRSEKLCRFFTAK